MKYPQRRGYRSLAAKTRALCSCLVGNHSASSLDEVFSFPATIQQNWSAGRIARASACDSPAAGADLSSGIYEHMIRAQRAVILLNEERRKYWMPRHLGKLLQSSGVAARRRETTAERLRDAQTEEKSGTVTKSIGRINCRESRSLDSACLQSRSNSSSRQDANCCSFFFCFSWSSVSRILIFVRESLENLPGYRYTFWSDCWNFRQNSSAIMMPDWKLISNVSSLDLKVDFWEIMLPFLATSIYFYRFKQGTSIFFTNYFVRVHI